MRLFKKLLKITGVLFVLVFLGLICAYFIYNKPLPKAKIGVEADQLANKLLNAINNDLYKQTRFLEWSFASGKHRYIWDKHNGKVNVKWNDNVVNLNLNKPLKSTATSYGKQVTNDELSELIDTAQNYFFNDSFWLVAPFKVFDPGTERSIVKLPDSSKGLLVTYASGGATPGDSYLWKVNTNGFPESYQMWVKIIPVGGLEATWDDWKVMENGLFLPASHKIGSMNLDMWNVRAYN